MAAREPPDWSAIRLIWFNIGIKVEKNIFQEYIVIFSQGL